MAIIHKQQYFIRNISKGKCFFTDNLSVVMKKYLSLFHILSYQPKLQHKLKNQFPPENKLILSMGGSLLCGSFNEMSQRKTSIVFK